MILNANTIDIWLIDLTRLRPQRSRFWAVLNPEEQARALRFHFERDQLRYTICRGAMRLILAEYLSSDPSSLEFSQNSYGKPLLADVELSFNLSHAGNYGLLGLSQLSTIGVDIEQERQVDDLASIAQHYFAPSERHAVLNAADQTAAFFRCWTRKEAYIKAHGMGLSLPLSSFAVSIEPHIDQALEWNRENTLDQWHVQPLAAPAGYAAALACPRSTEEMQVQQRECLRLAD
ncbi:4'-phosphopantetheinyl transferase family protein [Herpetosiphon geysericola]|uniref:4'-phosphopantetheinyl transferase family protein n=1 Tax=Herpetosiphon geysericola TaxID=70996 RepID=UPI0006C92C09|nr:4'-phosphopantetheinyl transferase superfamily protein [Herpetosiphon geysericola]